MNKNLMGQVIDNEITVRNSQIGKVTSCLRLPVLL